MKLTNIALKKTRPYIILGKDTFPLSSTLVQQYSGIGGWRAHALYLQTLSPKGFPSPCSTKANTISLDISEQTYTI